MTDTYWRCFCFAVLVGLISSGCSSTSFRWTDSVEVIERAPRRGELATYPAEAQTVGVNPPGFCWTPHEKAASYRLEVRESGGLKSGFSTEPQTSTVYPPFRSLKPAVYDWQVVYLDQNGAAVGASRTRRFTLPNSAPELLMPDVQALKVRLAGVRPRLFLGAGRLERLRAAIAKGSVPSWDRLRQAADAALDEELYPEPRYLGSGAENWLRTFTPGKVGSAHLARTALAYTTNVTSSGNRSCSSLAVVLPALGPEEDEVSALIHRWTW